MYSVTCVLKDQSINQSIDNKVIGRVPQTLGDSSSPPGQSCTPSHTSDHEIHAPCGQVNWVLEHAAMYTCTR